MTAKTLKKQKSTQMGSGNHAIDDGPDFPANGAISGKSPSPLLCIRNRRRAVDISNLSPQVAAAMRSSAVSTAATCLLFKHADDEIAVPCNL